MVTRLHILLKKAITILERELEKIALYLLINPPPQAKLCTVCCTTVVVTAGVFVIANNNIA